VIPTLPEYNFNNYPQRGPEISFAPSHSHRCTVGSSWWIYCPYNTWNVAPPFMLFTMPVSRYESHKRVRPLRLSQTEFRCLWSVFGKRRVKTRVGFQSRKPAWELIKTVNHHHPTTTPYFSRPPKSVSSSPFRKGLNEARVEYWVVLMAMVFWWR